MKSALSLILVASFSLPAFAAETKIGCLSVYDNVKKLAAEYEAFKKRVSPSDREALSKAKCGCDDKAFWSQDRETIARTISPDVPAICQP